MTGHVTTQQAADILNVSRNYVERLIAERAIPSVWLDSQHRLLIADVLEYKRKRDAERERGLAELTAMSQEMGDYFE